MLRWGVIRFVPSRKQCGCFFLAHSTYQDERRQGLLWRCGCELATARSALPSVSPAQAILGESDDACTLPSTRGS